MLITVLTIPGCPNASVVQRRITSALGGRGAEVELVEVHDQAQAIERGMTGSPTILLDGCDPFDQVTAAPNMSCRLFRNANGTVAGAPSETALREAIDEALGRTTA